MDRRTLIKGFLKIFVPLATGSVAAMMVGTLVGTALGMGAHHTFFYTVVPIMAGGIGEGAIPLSIGYADILQQNQGEILAQVLPPVMLGSLTAILLSGMLNYVGKKYPHLTGEGRLQPGEHDDFDPKQEEISGQMDVSHIAAAGIMAISLYLLGILCFNLFGLPAPVSMLFIAVVVKLAHGASPKLQEGAYVVYRFFAVAVVYPVLFLVGVAITPWDKLVECFSNGSQSFVGVMLKNDDLFHLFIIDAGAVNTLSPKNLTAVKKGADDPLFFSIRFQPINFSAINTSVTVIAPPIRVAT